MHTGWRVSYQLHCSSAVVKLLQILKETALVAVLYLLEESETELLEHELVTTLAILPLDSELLRELREGAIKLAFDEVMIPAESPWSRSLILLVRQERLSWLR